MVHNEQKKTRMAVIMSPFSMIWKSHHSLKSKGMMGHKWSLNDMFDVLVIMITVLSNLIVYSSRLLLEELILLKA